MLKITLGNPWRSLPTLNFCHSHTIMLPIGILGIGVFSTKGNVNVGTRTH